MSIMVFSCRSKAAPSLISLRATSSVTRPSRMKCCLRTSGRGFPLGSNTSLMVSRWLGGKGTPETQQHGVSNTFFFFFIQLIFRDVSEV